jgi:endoglucanase
MDYLTLLQDLNACHAPAGDERDIAARLKELAESHADECSFDSMGNLILRKKGTGPKILFAAHMDSIGLIVTHIEKNGYLRMGKIGGIHLNSILHTPFRFKNGVSGVVALSEKVQEKDMTLQDLYLDIGAKTQEEAEKMVQVGDTAVSNMLAFPMGNRLVSPYMDNRISCIVLLEVLRQIQSYTSDLYFVFTVQEELGMRGAKTAAYRIDPDYGIAVDVTKADALDSKHKGSTVLGGGAAIKVMDKSVICHPQVVEQLTTLADTNGINYQKDVSSDGGTDAGAIHLNRMGVLTGGICVPCRYLHSSIETVDVGDVQDCIKLLLAFAQATL